MAPSREAPPDRFLPFLPLRNETSISVPLTLTSSAIGQPGRRQQQEEFLEIEALDGALDGKRRVVIRDGVQHAVASPGAVDGHDTDVITAAERTPPRSLVLLGHPTALPQQQIWAPQRTPALSPRANR